MKTRLIAFSIALSVLTMLLIPSAAFASSKGRKNTALVLGALTIHQALKGKTGNALALGAGTAYAYKRYKDSRSTEKRRALATRRAYYRRHVAKRHVTSKRRYARSHR